MNGHIHIFDSNNVNWTDGQPEFNLIFLRHMESYLNDRMRAYGHVFLNEVYDKIGLPRTKEGQTFGWWLDVNNPNHPNQVRLSLTLDRENQTIQIEFLGAQEIVDNLSSEES